MKFISVRVGLLLVALALVPVARAGDIGADVQSIISDKVLARATVGVKVLRLSGSAASSEAVFQLRSHELFTPASNLKIVTTSAALDKLGADFKFRTMLVRHGRDLVIIGDGDPALGDAEVLRKLNMDATTVFATWAAGLAKLGINDFNNVLVDDSVFEQEFVHPRWPADQLEKDYEAGVAGLNLNGNCLDVFVHAGRPGDIVQFTTDPPTAYVSVRNTCITGSQNAVRLSRPIGGNTIILRGQTRQTAEVPAAVTIADPSMFTGTVLAETLKAGGVVIHGSVSRDRTLRAAYLARAAGDKDWSLLAVNETPLLTVIARANKDSKNLYAECLCKRLGFAATGEGSWSSGTSAVGSFLRGLGVGADEFNLDDGCGLSKQDSVSPTAMVSVLMHDYFSKDSRAYLATLSVAGSDGTLLDRFQGSDLRGRVIGKSGFVNGVSALSGFMTGRDGHVYVFSILINGIPDLSNGQVKVLEEKIVHAVDVDCTLARSATAVSTSDTASAPRK
jgi:D-alanyl-D-alanine carboxypeptidase/D-alanyl-D-alanine-endopeptidase (penicillin-binding protein 4)